MKKILALSFVLILSFFSCKNSEKEKQSEDKIELSEKGTKTEQKEKQSELNSEVQKNIIHCENDAFIIKIDRLKNDDIRYTSWNKPKKTTDAPNLTLYNGKIEKQGTGGGYHYIFKNGEWEYSIENNFMGETKASMGVFLKISKNGKQVQYTKMKDLTKKENHDKNAYTKNDLIGNWWTPHYAVRKVDFYKNETFLFKEGDGRESKGKYSISNKTVVLAPIKQEYYSRFQILIKRFVFLLKSGVDPGSIFPLV